MASTHEHLEHAEHAGHAAHDPFDRRVAVSMAIIAACLAGVSTLGHRKHNDVLRVVGEANRLRTEAAASDVEKSNLFAWYQARKLRNIQYESAVLLASGLPADKVDQKVIAGWKEKLAEVKDPTKWKKPDDDIDWINRQGKAKEAEAKVKLKEADDLKDDAVHNHHQADRLDIAHLSAEVGLVVCSLALLTKRRAFWYIGMTATAVSLAVAGSAFLMAHHDAAGHDIHAPTTAHEEPHRPNTTVKDAGPHDPHGH